MKSPKNAKSVERVLRNALRKDKARFDITRMSKFGIVELSRQRLKPAKASARYTTCATCGGGGTVKTVESSAIAMLHKLRAYLTHNSPENIVINLPEEVVLYLLNNKRKELSQIEKQSKIKVTIQIKPGMKSDDYQFETA